MSKDNKTAQEKHDELVCTAFSDHVNDKVNECIYKGEKKPPYVWLRCRGIGIKSLNKLESFGVVSRDHQFVELSVRTAWVLRNKGIETRAAARAAIESGDLSLKTRNYGKRSEKELCDFLGIEVPKKGKGPWKFDPWTGEPISQRTDPQIPEHIEKDLPLG